MPAIPRHKTPTVDKEWDGPGNEAQVRSGEDYSYYRQIYAWRDPEGEEDVKSAYKFIHHEVDNSGNPGAANVRGCITGISVLNGAMGGTSIPRADYQGVYNHLAAHLRDADIEPPELRTLKAVKEVRSMPIESVDMQDDKMLIQGYAIRFNEPAVFNFDGVEYREVISDRALDKTDMRDVPLKYNHSDDVMIMARTRNKTLQLIKDEQGLRIIAELANTTAGRDLYELIKRGDIDKMSFAFTVSKDEYDTETRTRKILSIDKLFDVSAVDTPAYDTTSLSLRSYFEAEAEKQRIALEKASRRKRLIIKTYF
jgi:hypothetical protein